MNIIYYYFLGTGSRGRRGSGTARAVRSRGRAVPEDPFKWIAYTTEDPYEPDWLMTYKNKRGVLVDTSTFQPVDYFKLFFPDEVFTLMKTQSNVYREQMAARGNFTRHSRLGNMKPVEDGDMEAFVALQIAMGLCNKPAISDYWSTYWLTKVKFSDVMPRNRYENLNYALHFTDNTQRVPAGEEGYNPLFKVQKLLEIVDPLYLQAFCPSKNLSLDETMIKFKGRIFFRQFMPAKPTRFGIKQFALCEAETGYALRFLTYTGKDTLTNTDPNLSITENVVRQLVRGFENCGHTLYTDSYYTSPVIVRELQKEQIGYVGTVSAGRKFMPTFLHPNNLPLAKRSDPVFGLATTADIVACTWHDTKRVSFISSVHTNNTVSKDVRARGHEGGHRSVEKPVIADSYNDCMGGVDTMDQLLGTYCYPHKVSKWYHAVYQRVREVALVNGYIVYCQANEGQKLLSPKAFREGVIDGLLENFVATTKPVRQTETPRPTRLTERHFPKFNTGSSHRPDCTVCSSRTKPGWSRVQTRWECKQCGVPMCVEKGCFEMYHTQANFERHAGRIFYNE